MFTKNTCKQRRWSWFASNMARSTAIVALLFAGATPLTAAAQEDEWYDPGDWFDNNNVEYDDSHDVYGDYDYNDDVYGYGDEYYHGEFDTNAAYDRDIEYEPDEGYHSEEWYDPSDWFNEDNAISYEDMDDTNDYRDDFNTAYDYNYGYDYDYGLFDDNLAADYDYENDVDYGWHYDEQDNRWEYGYERDEADYRQRQRADYDTDRSVQGEVVGFQRVRASADQPESVKLRIRTQDGKIRTIMLGDRGYVSENLPRLQQGERIAIRGRQIVADGKSLFKATDIRGRDGEFTIPDYRYNQTVRGRLIGLKNVKLDNGNVEAIVARVRADDGNTMNVLLGSPAELRQTGQNIRPNSQIEIDGWTRTTDDGRTKFYVQNVRIKDQGQRQDMARR